MAYLRNALCQYREAPNHENEDQLKIAIACSGAGHVTRGVEAWAKELAYALEGTGKIEVAFLKGGGSVETPFEKVVPCLNRSSFLLLRRHTSIGYEIEQVTFATNLIKEIRSSNYGIVHVADPRVAACLLEAKKLGSLRTEIVFNHMVGGDHFSAKFSTVDVLAPYFKERARLDGINTERWFVIPPIVDTAEFCPPGNKNALRSELGIPQDAFVVASVGALEDHQKRMKAIVREVALARELTHRRVFFLAAGAFCGNETMDLLSFAREVLGGDCKILANVRHSSMPAIYKVADMFCLGELRPVFGICFIEAMSSGLPVLGSIGPVTRWIFGDGGECIDMAQEGAAATMIKKFLLDEEYRIQRGTIARRRACELFSKPAVVEKVLEMYSEAIRMSSPVSQTAAMRPSG